MLYITIRDSFFGTVIIPVCIKRIKKKKKEGLLEGTRLYPKKENKKEYHFNFNVG